MIPIHSFLARIRWDPHFGRGRWEIAYHDRVLGTLIRVPLEEIRTQPHIGFVFEVVDEEGVSHAIPYHRVRQVWRDGKLAWSRPVRTPPRREEKPRPVRRKPAQQPRMRR